VARLAGYAERWADRQALLDVMAVFLRDKPAPVRPLFRSGVTSASTRTR